MYFGDSGFLSHYRGLTPEVRDMKSQPHFPKWLPAFNRFARRFAGVSRTPFAMLYHVGRRSGKTYEIPIIVMPFRGGFVFALTYGTEVDWYRNVLAAGRANLLWHNQEYTLENPEPLDAQTALLAFPVLLRPILRLRGTQDFMRMTSREVR
jgi:deazaflavin-dependent oxidoreductase (nitroreductase family)